MILYHEPPDLQLPWSVGSDDNARFFKLLLAGSVVFLGLAIAVPLIQLPELEREEQEKLPENLARLVLEEQVIPEPTVAPPPPVEVEEEPVVEELPEPEEKPEPTPVPTPRTEPKPPPPAEAVAEARERAATSGLLQFKDDLQDMRDMLDLDLVTSAETRRDNSEAASLDRNLLASQATAKSGGITTDELSRDTGGVAISGKETTLVDSSLALPGGTGAEALYREPESNSDGPPARSEEQMRRVMDANKSAIFAIYHRALRRDPTLEGKVVIEMTIQPSGQVSGARIVSSQLEAPALEQQLLSRIRLIQFEPGNFAVTILNQAFDFLPY